MATTLALQRFKLSSEEKKKRYGTFFRGGHFAPLTGGLAFWAHSKRLARAEERILSSKKLLGLAEQVMLTAELVLLNRELFVRL